MTPQHARLDSRTFQVGDGTEVRRLVPQRRLRTVGAWCFADHYGPDDVTDGAMVVPPHPHTGLQTVSWLLEGAVEHRDSLGHVQVVRPGEVSLMTSGWGISHSEYSPDDRPDRLHGVQLWVALPDAVRRGEGGYEHLTGQPVVQHGALTATVVLGEHVGTVAPGTVHSPLVGLDVAVAGAAALPLAAGFEHAVFPLTGEVTADGELLQVGQVLDLGTGRSEVDLAGDGRVMVLGGEPLGEPLVLWWNFVCRSAEEVVAAREEWNAVDDPASRFGQVAGAADRRLPAPALGPARLMPRS